MTSKSPENPIRRVIQPDGPVPSSSYRPGHLRSTSRFAPAIRSRTIARIRSWPSSIQPDAFGPPGPRQRAIWRRK
jgi:hypothetical protein